MSYNMFASLAMLLLHFCAMTALHFNNTTVPSCNVNFPPYFPPSETISMSVLCVDPSCNFTTVQGAVDGIPDNSSKRTILWINKGTYIAKVTVTKPNITFQGQGFKETILVCNNKAKTSKGTTKSASVDIRAAGFIAKNIRFKNCVLNCISGEQPTGDKIVNVAITAQAREFATNNTSFSFVNCIIKGNSQILLGRAYRPYSRVVFAHTYMPSVVAPKGWSDRSNDRTVFYGEYMCTGEGANRTHRAPYSVNLSDEQVKPYLNSFYLDGENWLKPFTDSLVTP